MAGWVWTAVVAPKGDVLLTGGVRALRMSSVGESGAPGS